MPGIEELSKDEFENVKGILLKLIESLRDKKAHGLMIPDEEFILNSLTHPERGDVKVIILKDHDLEIFLANRRDETFPFSVMSNLEMRSYSDRKFIDGVRSTLKDGHYGLFLISQQDQNHLASSKSRVESYSAFFNISETTAIISGEDAHKDLKTKKLEDCSIDDKWMIYKKSWDMDSRISRIETELFGIKVVYAKYKQKYNEELIVFSPKKYKEKIGQLIRDIYPPNIRMSLKKDFPKDHNKNVEEVKKVLNSIVKNINEKMEFSENSDGYKNYLSELKHLFETMITKDPDLSGTV